MNSLQKAGQQRQVNLALFNKEAEAASQQTKQTEDILKNKEIQRHEIQVKKEAMEKQLVELNEKNL